MLNTVFGIILLAAAVFLLVAVLMQSGKDKRLSGSIAGGAETFFGKAKGGTIDKKLSKLTTIVAVVFVLLVIITYVIQDDTDFDALLDSLYEDTAEAQDSGNDTAEPQGGDDDTDGENISGGDETPDETQAAG